MANERKVKAGNEPSELKAKAWISMKRGVILISITSIGMFFLTAVQAIPARGWMEGILWSIFFGILIWLIFFGMIFINRFLRR